MSLDTLANQVLDTLRADGVAVVPTAAGYGLLGMGPGAVARIYEMKGRPRSKPCVTVTTWPIFDDVALPLAADVRARIDATTARAPLAVVAPLNPASRLLADLDPFVRAQCTQAGTLATFHAAGALVAHVAALAFAQGRLVLGSSGNRSGQGNAYTLDAVADADRADLIVDQGPIAPLDGAPLPATIVDLAARRFLREGLRFAEIRAIWAGLVPPT